MAASALAGSALGPEWSRSLRRHESNGTAVKRLERLHTEFQCQCVAYRNNGEDKWTPIENEERHSAENPPDMFSDCLKVTDDDDDWPLQVKLSNGHIYACDLVISATGVLPNTEFMRQSDKHTPFVMLNDQSLEVNDKLQCRMKTPEGSYFSADIFAAGDCCSLVEGEEGSPHWFQMRLWSQARTMGMYAAHAAAGLVDELGSGMNFELFTHMSNFFGHKIVLLGQFNGQNLTHDQQEELRTRVVTAEQICTKETGFALAQARSKQKTIQSSVTEKVLPVNSVPAHSTDPTVEDHSIKVLFRVSEEECIKIVLKHGRVVGAMLIGDTDLEETFENLILSQLEVSSLDLLDPEFDLEDYFD